MNSIIEQQHRLDSLVVDPAKDLPTDLSEQLIQPVLEVGGGRWGRLLGAELLDLLSDRGDEGDQADGQGDQGGGEGSCQQGSVPRSIGHGGDLSGEKASWSFTARSPE